MNLLSDIPEWKPSDIKFADTIVGEVFSECIKGNVAIYGGFDSEQATNVHEMVITPLVRSLIDEKEIPYEYDVLEILFSEPPYNYGPPIKGVPFTSGVLNSDLYKAVNNPQGGFARFSYIDKQHYYDENDKTYKLAQNPKIRLIENKDTDTCIYIIEKIGCVILDAIYKFVDILFGDDDLKSDERLSWILDIVSGGYIELEDIYYDNAIYYQNIYAEHIVIKHPFVNGCLTPSYVSFSTSTNRSDDLCYASNILKDDVITKRINSAKWNLKVAKYLQEWRKQLPIQLEKKRVELAEGKCDLYDERISKLVASALDEEAAEVGCTADMLPRFTVDSIIRTIRKEHPRADTDDKNITVMKALVPYVEATCAGLIAKAHEFLKEPDE